MRRLHELVEKQPPHGLALIDHDGSEVTYRHFDRLARQLAGMLCDHGVRAGDRVILVAENSVLYACCVMAASRLDAWLVLVNARQSEAELAAILDHSGARCMVFTSHVSEPAARHAATHGATVIGRILGAPVLASPPRDADREPVTDTADQVAVLLYTTGTTSAPKGVMLTHDNLLFSAQKGAAYFGVTADDRVLGVLPGTHVFALSSVFLNCLAAGAAIRFMPRFDPADVLGHLRGGITRFPGVPQMFAAIMAHCDATGAPLLARRLRFLQTGGAPLDPGLKMRVERFFGLPLCNGYGLTETSPSIASTHPDRPCDDISVGPPYPWIETRIADPAPDGIGEIQVRGRNVTKGYFRAAEQTARAMTGDGFFRTGDLGRIDAAGNLHIAGRLKELIIRSGFNVHPPEIEAMLSRHPDVYAAAVVGRQVPGNEEIIAFVKTGGQVSGPLLRDWLKTRLAAYKLPRLVLVVEDWPAASTGKVLKHRLLDHFADLLAEAEGTA